MTVYLLITKIIDIEQVDTFEIIVHKSISK
jgi:hypothetical protein